MAVFNGRRFEGGGSYDPVLNNNTWEQIAQAYRGGAAQDLWPVGSAKTLIINGLVGTQQFTNYECEAVVIGYDHNADMEGPGITFQIGKLNGTDICLVDSHYDSGSTNGAKWFNINHSGNNNAGGWKNCDMRYDILGSTDIKNGNATAACAISPVENTLMAALPSDLRVAMTPMTIWTDNVGGGSNTASDVTSTVDYLPLLAEFEIYGSTSYSNSGERNYQRQYQYYKNSNSKVKYRYDNIGSAATWWERSPYYGSRLSYCCVFDSNIRSYRTVSFSHGIAPIFRIS